MKFKFCVSKTENGWIFSPFPPLGLDIICIQSPHNPASYYEWIAFTEGHVDRIVFEGGVGGFYRDNNDLVMVTSQDLLMGEFRFKGDIAFPDIRRELERTKDLFMTSDICAW